jgi:hypothetical protein
MEITKDTKVAEVLRSYPSAGMVFKRHGFFTLMARMQGGSKDEITIERACLQHGVDMAKLLENLRKETTPQPTPQESGEIVINKKMKTTEVTNRYPAAKAVFAKHFGKGCFDCPAFGTEDVAFACLMHNTNVDQFVKECIEAVKKEREAKAV